MNILSGVYQPDAGEIRLEGNIISFADPRTAIEAGVAIIHQELNQILQLSVGENIYLGREPKTAWGLIDTQRMNRDAQQLLDRLELAVDPRTPIHRLSVGARQVVEIAKALSTNARVMIMDEPTSAISEQEVLALFRVIADLKQAGVGIIYITHKFDELAEIADDITVLRDGKFIASRPFKEVSYDEMIHLMVGRELADLFPKTVSTSGDEILSVSQLTLIDRRHPGRKLVDNVTFTVKRREVVGLFGLMGAGRTELLQAIFGLHPHETSGQIFVDERPLEILSPQSAITAGLALAPEDRKDEGLVLSLSVAENVSMSSLDKIETLGFLSRAKEEALTNHYVSRLRVKIASFHQKVRTLSGGNQQKVVLSKWLATNPRVLLLDEPTRGIDINSKREIYALIDEFAQSGLGVVLVSSELPEILAIADRIIVMSEGCMTAEFLRDEATAEKILHAALPTKKAIA